MRLQGFGNPCPYTDYLPQTEIYMRPELAAALSALSQMEQEIIFLYYFQRLTHREIGRRYGRAGNTTGRRIQMILRRLRAELEGLSYEPATFL